MASTAPSGYSGRGVSQVQALRLSILSEILNALDPMATDADTLMGEGRCFQCAGASPADIMELQLLGLINDAVGGGGGGGGLANPPVVYTTDPNTEALTPADPTKPAMAYSADGSGSIFGWRVGTQTWV